MARSLLLLFLVCARPFVAFTASNLHEDLNRAEIAAYAGATFALLTGIYLGLTAALRPTSYRLASLCAVFAIVFFNYGELGRVLEARGWNQDLQALAWLATAIAALAVAFVFGARANFHQFLILFSAALVGTSLYTIATYDPPPQGPGLHLEEAYPLTNNEVWTGRPVRRPNVYLILADSYPSPSQLRAVFGFDNSDFVEALEARGFGVSRDGFANFNTTRLSVPTTLNMEYVFEAGEVQKLRRGRAQVNLPGRTNRGLRAAVGGDNRSVGFLKQVGYTYVHYDDGYFRLTGCRGHEDVCIRNRARNLSEVQTSLRSLIPHPLIERFFPMLSTAAIWQKPTSGTGIPELSDALVELDADEPVFVYAHLSTPHRPFTNQADCELRPPLWVGATKDDFIAQVQCVNRQLLTLLDRLLHEDPASIVVLASDHGPRFTTLERDVNLYEMTRAQIREHLGILTALRLPDDCRDPFRPDLSPVNHMRVVFACLGGHPPRLVEARHFVVRPGLDHPDFGKIRRVYPRRGGGAQRSAAPQGL